MGGAAHLRLLGSFDRFNYGDLLFPLVTRFALQRLRPDLATIVYGLVESDLSRFGALPSRGIARLYDDVRKGDVVLMAGGENLAQTWKAMLVTLRRPGEAGTEGTEAWARSEIGGRDEFPYLPRRRSFGEKPRLAYSSCGGWPLEGFSSGERAAIGAALGEAGFVSVRESHTARLLGGLPRPVRCSVAPDCAFLLPEMWSREELARRASDETRAGVERAGPYLAFQCHDRYGAVQGGALPEALSKLSRATGLPVVPVAIGRMTGFSDDRFLAELSDRVPCRTVRAEGLADVAYVLANARLFVGTSLHGVVTATTHGVRALPLATPDPKLGHNLDFWGIPGLERCVGLDELPALAARSIPPPGGKLDELRGAVWRNFEALVRWL